MDFLEAVQAEVRWQTSEEFEISLDVDDALRFSWRAQPFEWEESHIRHYLPVLFAISQRETFSDDPRSGLSNENYRFRQATFEVTKFIVENTYEILDGWRDPGTMYDNAIVFQSHDGVQATVSFGCIEVDLGEVDTMVKTTFSLGGYGCTDTDPDLYNLD